MKIELIGKLLTLKYRDRKNTISGILVDFNNDFTLLKHNIVDYIIDGYIILKSKNVLKVKHEENEIFTEKVLKLKGNNFENNDLLSDNLSLILEEITNKYIAFGFELKDDSKYYIGKFIKIQGDYLYIQTLNVNGTWNGVDKYKHNQIRVINFDTDYINSLLIYNKSLNISTD